MPSCAFPSCNYNARMNKENLTKISLHCFPKDVKRRKAWIQFVNKENWEPSKGSRLCTKHFAERDVDRTSLAYPIRLRENAIPTIGESQVLQMQENAKVRPILEYAGGTWYLDLIRDKTLLESVQRKST
ncbi:THAP domain-containing protein 2-like [Diabrotica virgifera virgifera]|uniref:THAP-type domain-containing protein n=1 Tax=Diabrotica virgifera virgifera TaxID=50390 RepID=A0ABM5KCI9_DIAVI|nr:THAP domain-containing protein 2-like [Diabrotica virgifera virgifera]